MDLKSLAEVLWKAVENFPKEDPDKQLDQAMQILQLAVNTLATIFVALLAYLVARRQVFDMQITREIERQRLIHELQHDYSSLSNMQAMFIRGRANFNGKQKYKFVVALTRDFRWDRTPSQISHTMIDSDRFFKFTQDNSMLNSTILHEFLYWFRHVEKAYNADLLKKIDLLEFWRHTLPFATDRRYTFLSYYFAAFGKAPLGEDIFAVSFILRETVAYCVEKEIRTPCQYLWGRMDPLFARLLPSDIKRNIRTLAQLPPV